MDYTKFNKSQEQFTSDRYASYDVGLRDYMLGVYKNMSIALLITGLISFFVGSSPALLRLFFSSPLFYIVLLAPVGLVIYMSARFTKMSINAARNCLWLYSGLMGLSLASLFAVYTGESITRTFFITSSVFGAMSIYGYTTKKDLSNFGSFLLMGLIGIIIASLVNMFVQSSGLSFIISIIGVLIFTGLTAYDVQNIRNIYFQVSGNQEAAGKFAIYGALSLYMNFINLFIYLLQFIGDRRSQ